MKNKAFAWRSGGLAVMVLPVMVLWLMTAAWAGNTYYVSPGGNDGNPGTMEQPWASPGYGSRRLQPGDTLIIRGGKYILNTEENNLRPGAGAADAWITIKGEAQNRPVLAGRDNLIRAVFLDGVNYVKLENLEITHDPSVTGPKARFRDGVSSWNPISHIILENLYIHHLDEMGVNIRDVNYMQILNCRIEYCGMGAIGGPTGEAGGIRNLFVKGCKLSYSGHYYRGGRGPNPHYDRPDGFGLEPSDGPIEIVDTVAEHNRGDGLDSKPANTYIHNCVVANNSCDGIKLWGNNSKIENCLVYGTGDGVGGDSAWAGIVIHSDDPNTSFEMLNVTVHDNPSRRNYPMYVQYGINAPLKLVMRNCIIANGYGLVYIGPTVKFTATHNLFYRPGEPEQVEANGRTYTGAEVGRLGPGNISLPPKFVRPAWGAAGDYHLVGGSPGIDAGTATGAPLVDLEYRPRPRGKGVDMGAYEY